MKRTIPLLFISSFVGVVAGLAAAQLHISRREHDLAERKLVETNETKKPAKDLAQLVAAADEIVISYRGTDGDHEVRFRDTDWLTRFAGVIGAASFEPTPHGLWASSPRIQFYRSRKETLELMVLGKVVRAYGDLMSGDFIVGSETTQAILLLAQEKAPNKVLQSTPTFVMPPAAPELRRP